MKHITFVIFACRLQDVLMSVNGYDNDDGKQLTMIEIETMKERKLLNI